MRVRRDMLELELEIWILVEWIGSCGHLYAVS